MTLRMGEFRTPPRVTPLAAVLYTHDDEYTAAREALVGLLGAVALESEAFAFDRTHYYDDEMGAGLTRRFVSFEALADPAALADWKRAANDLEAQLAHSFGNVAGRTARARPVNVDPGYLTAAKLVLASTKDFAHRLYLRDGIFAEITLHYRDGAWQAHPFTFPDFKADTYHAFLKRARDAHMRNR